MSASAAVPAILFSDLVVEAGPRRRRDEEEAEHRDGDGHPAHDLVAALGDREPGDGRAARGEQGGHRQEDLAVGLGEVAPQERGDADQGGEHDGARRPDPEESRIADSGDHALAAAFCFFTAFFTMKRSICSCASSSRICFGGDFIR